MTLPTLADAKNHLRIQTTAEDAVVADLLLDAQAAVETYLGVRITAATDTMIDRPDRNMRAYGRVQQLLAARYPFATSSPAPVITDSTGATVDPATYTLDGRAGLIIANPGVVFANGPYTIVASVGVSAHPEYATRLERNMRRAILDIVSDLYQRRNPGARMESEGGVSVQYGAEIIPPRTLAYLASCRVGPLA